MIILSDERGGGRESISDNGNKIGMGRGGKEKRWYYRVTILVTGRGGGECNRQWKKITEFYCVNHPFQINIIKHVLASVQYINNLPQQVFTKSIIFDIFVFPKSIFTKPFSSPNICFHLIKLFTYQVRDKSILHLNQLALLQINSITEKNIYILQPHQPTPHHAT